MPGSARPRTAQTTAVVILIGALSLLGGCGGTTAAPSAETATATPVATASAPTEGITRITLPDLGGNMLAAGNFLWDATDAGAVRVDLTTGAVSDPIEGITNLAFDGTRLWAGGEHLLLELDPGTGEVIERYTPEHSACYLAATPEAVWASDTMASVLQRIDPATGEVVATIDVPSTPKGTTFGEGSVWIACDGAGVVVRVDPATNAFVEIPVGNGPHSIAIADGWAWVINRFDSTLSKIDPKTNEVVATVSDVGTSPAVGVEAGSGRVFAAYSGGIAVIDPEAAAITDRIAIPRTGFYDLKLVGNTLWASDTDNPALYAVDLDVWP